MMGATEDDATRTATCVGTLFEAVDRLEKDGFSEFNIVTALTLLLQGRGVTPAAYAATFEEGKAVYEDFQQYHIDDDGSALPPPVP